MPRRYAPRNDGKCVRRSSLIPSMSLISSRYSSCSRFERSQQSRGDRSGAVAIEDCWLWLIMAENLFSKTIIRLRQRFAIANNSHTQISRPRRHRLTNPSLDATKKRAVVNYCSLWRKERDSNPRTREDQRFSRPPHSTTLPSFQAQRYYLFSILQNFS